MRVSSLLYSGAVALFVAAGIAEIVERRAEAKTWQEATTLNHDGGKGATVAEKPEAKDKA